MSDDWAPRIQRSGRDDAPHWTVTVTFANGWWDTFRVPTHHDAIELVKLQGTPHSERCTRHHSADADHDCVLQVFLDGCEQRERDRVAKRQALEHTEPKPMPKAIAKRKWKKAS